MAKPVPTSNPKKQLDSFIDKFDPKIASLARRALTKMRQRLPGSIEMVYDNFNALTIGYVPDERPSNAIFSIVLYPRHINLFFLQGVGLPDPDGLLQGAGNQVRHIKLESIAILDDPAVVSLMNTALHRAKVPLDRKQPRKLMIKAIAAKQRPRRV